MLGLDVYFRFAVTIECKNVQYEASPVLMPILTYMHCTLFSGNQVTAL
jgi:hypothetical protein